MLFVSDYPGGGVPEQMNHFAQHKELDKACPYRKPAGAAQQKGNKYISPKNVVSCINQLYKIVHLLGFF